MVSQQNDQISDTPNQEAITKAIVQNIHKYRGSNPGYILKASNEKNQEIITNAIVQNISLYYVAELNEIFQSLLIQK